jgi:hypothetical protein
MQAGKNQASQRPTAFGSMLQASTYGLVIPVPYGRCQTPLYAIWANNLRQGGSIKKFKQMKKGMTAFCENINFLIGKNPILMALQTWNNGAILPLSDQVYTTTATAGTAGVFTVPDPYFYSITGVTLEVAYSETFNDYGSHGSQTLTGTFEVPLWNQLFAGPDPTASSDPRNFPYCYRWNPLADGAMIHIDNLAFGALPTGTLRIYYTQMVRATKYQPPISRMRLAFENILGSGDEYDGNVAGTSTPLATQQILYPHYAGLGSSEIDLGSTGTIPAIKQEVQAKWGISSGGDCDFVDIIEDVVKSGITQAALGSNLNFGATQHGTGCYNLPGTIQKKLATSNNASGLPAMLYDMPNTQGNILVCSATGQAALSIASSNGEAWNPIWPGSLAAYQVWWATAAGGTNTVTVSGAGQPSEVCIMEIGGVGQANVAVDSYTTVFPGAITNASGTVLKNYSAPLGLIYVEALWDTFEMVQPLPSDAVIQGIYPVMVAGYTANHAPSGISYGTSLVPTDGYTNPAGASVFGGGSSSFSSTEMYGGSVGTLLSALTNLCINAYLGASTGPIFDYTPVDEIDVSAVGVAVYYTSAHVPSGTPPIPPPFTIPGGQGVAWAMPTRFRSGGQFNSYPPGGGDPNFQVALGNTGGFTPATVVTSSTPIITDTGGSFSVQAGGTTARKGSIGTTVAAGWPAFLLSVPFYGGDSPASSQVAKWEALLPANFYAKALATFQAHGRIVKNPGSYSFTAPGTDPTALAMLSIKYLDAPQFPQPGGSFINVPSMDLVRAQCRAGGLFGSLSMTAQKAARDWIQDLCDAADCAPVFSGHQLYLHPRSEVSAVGNGAVYISPTASGPVADLDVDNGDFVTQKGQPAIKATRKSRVGDQIYTVLQMQHVNRVSAYQQVTTAEPDAAGIVRYGVRKEDPTVNDAVQDVVIARSILRILIRRMNYVENMSYEFSLNQRWAPLNSMSLVTITDRSQGIVKVPVRLTSWEEDDKLEIACQAEPFVYGIHAPQILPVTTPTPYSGNGTVNLTAGNVNPPIIMEPVSRLYSGTKAQLWLVISSSATNYGGSQVYVSTDGGASYNPLGSPVIGNATTGVLTADWPAATDPDTANNLLLDLTESNGMLESYAVSDEDNFVYPCYVAGQQLIVKMNGTTIALLSNTTIKMNGVTIASSGNFGYELMTYANALLTGTSLYTLEATAGSHLRRAVFNAPDSIGNGIDHPSGSRFAFLSPAGTGILKVDMDAVWVGQTLYFKVLSFNEFGSAAQSLTDVPAYAYTPTGVPSTV